MPQFTVEYTANIREQADISGLLKKVHDVIIGQDGGIFPPGGTRSRAIRLDEFRMADGAEDYAFVHATLKIGWGRTEEQKGKVCTELFEMMKVHFAALFQARYLALSMELYEFDENGTYKHNNVHGRFRKQHTSA